MFLLRVDFPHFEQIGISFLVVKFGSPQSLLLGQSRTFVLIRCLLFLPTDLLHSRDCVVPKIRLDQFVGRKHFAQCSISVATFKPLAQQAGEVLVVANPFRSCCWLR
jgi:hypothetical protein